MLGRLRAGDESALDQLVTILYDELHRIASCHLKGERAEHTLQPTALVHEAYLRLMSDSDRAFADRTHFLAVASRVMRQVLVDYARARSARKRAANARVSIEPGQHNAVAELEPELGPVDLLDLDTALDALARQDEALARLIELRYFGGMTAGETAEVLGQSVHVVRHDLRLAQAWLRRKLRLR
jgi:RNA polymerase sigma factor (TIGR02999 family)